MKNRIAETLQQALHDLYQIEWQADPSIMQKTKKEFEGDFTLVVFPFVKAARKAPDVVATELGLHPFQFLHSVQLIQSV